MIIETLHEKHYHPLTETELRRITQLEWASFKRGRRKYRMREFLETDRTEAKRYLFELLRKRVEVVPSANAEKNWCVEAAERAEKFCDRSYRKPESNQNIPEQVATLVPVVVSATTVATPPPDTAKPDIGAGSAVTIPATPQVDEVVESIATWFREKVQEKYWRDFEALVTGVIPMTAPRDSRRREGMDLPMLWDLTEPPPLNAFIPLASLEHHTLSRLMNWATRFLFGIYGLLGG